MQTVDFDHSKDDTKMIQKWYENLTIEVLMI